MSRNLPAVLAATACTLTALVVVAPAAQAASPPSHLGSTSTGPSLDEPGLLAVSPDGLHIWAPSREGGSSWIDSFGGSTSPTATRFSMGSSTDPAEVAFTPDSATAFVTATGTDQVVRINATTGAVEARITVGDQPQGVAAGTTSSGVRVFVANTVTGSVSVVDPTTNTVTATVTGVGSGPRQIALAPDGRRAYVGVLGGVAVIDTATNTRTSTISLTNGSGDIVRDLALSPDGGVLYVAHDTAGAGQYGSGYLSSYSTSTSAYLDSSIFDVNQGTPQTFSQLAVTPDGLTVYVGVGAQTSSAEIWWYDAADFAVAGSGVTEAGHQQAANTDNWGVAVSPTSNLLYVTGPQFPQYSIWGTFDVYSTPLSVPGAPRSTAAAPGSGSASVSWTAPASNGGSAITGYTATAAPGGATCTTSTLTCSVSGLTNGTSYTFRVTATNAQGTGPAGVASSAVTPVAAPTAPTAPRTPTATAGQQAATVSWTAPTTDGGSAITGYTVTASPGGATCTTATLTCQVTGLTAGTGHTFTVTATNAVGTGPASAATTSVTPQASLPGAPRTVIASSGDGAASVSWTAPASDGGAVITGYTVTSSPGGATCTTATLTCQVVGLTNGTGYTFTVRATNSAGAGPASTASTAVTPAFVRPGTPRAVVGTAGVSSVAVTWTAPAAGTGTVVDHYVVTASPGQATCTTSTTSCVLGGVAGVSYTVQVQAVDAGGAVGTAGTGTTTAVSSPTVATTVPNAPLTLTTDQGRLTTVAVGQSLVVLGSGFAAYSTATVVIYSTPTVLGTVVTDGNGDFSKPVVVPADLAAGEHNLVAAGVDPSGAPHSMRMTVQVAAAGSPRIVSTVTGGRLAVTGADLGAPLVTGGLLLLVGVVLLAAVRFRRAGRARG